MLTRPSHAESSALVNLVGVEAVLAGRLHEHLSGNLAVAVLDDQADLFRHMEVGGLPIDAAVLGMATEEAVRIAQRIHAYDKFIPIMILCPPAACEQIRRTLMFSPFLGNEVIPWPTDELDILPEALKDAVERRRQRQHLHNTLSRAQIRFEKLPLLKPEPTHYLDQLLNNAPVGVVTIDSGGTVLTINRRAQDILCVLDRNPLGKQLQDFFRSEEWQCLDTLRTECMRTSSSQCMKILKLHDADDSTRHVEVILAPLAYRTGQRGAMIIMQDVSLRVEAERKRQKVEEELRLHVTVLRRFHEISSSDALSFDAKMDKVLSLGCEQFRLPVGVLTRIRDQNVSVMRAVGEIDALTEHRKLARTYCGQTILSPEPFTVFDASKSQWHSHPAYQDSGFAAYIGARVQVNDEVEGTLCFMSRECRSHPFSQADRELLKLMSRWVASELQRERAEAHMRKLSSALEQTGDAVIITDRSRHIEYVNPSFESLTGYTKDEVTGQQTTFLRSGFHDTSFYEQLWHALGHGGVYRGVLINRKKDGSVYHEQRTISPLKDSEGRITHFISTGHDITELVEAQRKDRLHQAELAHVARLSTLGEMTSGLAHELNQPLCAITTYAQTCLRILQHGDFHSEQVRYGLEQVVRQAEIAGEIFRRLRNFARKGDMCRRAVSLKDVVNEVSGFIHAEANQNLVTLKMDLTDDLPDVYADPIQIQQVLLNLTRNAMDAVADREEGARRIRIGARRKDGHVRLSIRDSGRGCPPDIVDRLFEPFFTTKSNGLGIGLGISQSIIDAHGGRLWLSDSSSEGATFCFTLPIAKDDGNEEGTQH